MHRSNYGYVQTHQGPNWLQIHYTNSLLCKENKKAKIRNRYNQAPLPSWDTTLKMPVPSIRRSKSCKEPTRQNIKAYHER